MHSKNFSRDNSFPFLEDVIALTDIAMSSHDPRRIVPMLVDGMRNVIATDPELPSHLLASSPDRHVRRELYHSGRHDYQVLMIAWAPGQASGVHDHADAWGLEAVLRGQLDVVDFRIAAQHQAVVELREHDRHELRRGDVIGLLPPHDLHDCRNASASEVAVSLHVYGKALDQIRRFVPVEGAHYRVERTRLESV